MLPNQYSLYRERLALSFYRLYRLNYPSSKSYHMASNSSHSMNKGYNGMQTSYPPDNSLFSSGHSLSFPYQTHFELSHLWKECFDCFQSKWPHILSYNRYHWHNNRHWLSDIYFQTDSS